MCTCMRLLLFFTVAVMQIAWYSEDRPFAVGYADGKLLVGSKEPLENGSVVVIDAHKVHHDAQYKQHIYTYLYTLKMN